MRNETRPDQWAQEFGPEYGYSGAVAAYALGAQLQICEGARQLRGALSPQRQVNGAELALISGHGGNQVCHATLILGRA